MKRLFIRTLLLSMLVFVPLAPAQAAEIDQEEILTLQAAAAVMQRDFRAAESLYTRILGINANSVEATVQRALARRELNNLRGMEADASHAMVLIDTQLQQKPDSHSLYYQRSVAARLLKDFDAAEWSVRKSYSLGRHGLMENDLKAIALERKMAQ